MFRKYIILICIVAFALFANSAYADSTASLINEGNKSWIAGDYEEAINKYDEAAVDDPESPYIHFNRGAALYKKGDYSAAVESFEKAALKSKKPEMESNSRFNLGNCAFREAERYMDNDLKKSLEYCQKSIIHFQDALKLDPGNRKASENVEIVRLIMKNILDEIKKKEQEAKEKEQAAKENAEKIKQIIKRQEEALDKNRQISKDKLDFDEKKEKLENLADEQKNITRDTQEFTEEISSQAAQQNQEEENPALKHLNNAVKEQTAADKNLRNSDTGNAEKNQENAINELKEALKPPEQKQGNQGQDDKKNQQEQKEQQGQQEKQEQSSDQESQQKEEQSQDEDQATMQRASEDAQEILDEEKENKKQRRVMSSGGYRDVEKDW